MYMLAEIEPSSDLTGKPWITNGEPDDALILGLKTLCKRMFASPAAAPAVSFLSPKTSVHDGGARALSVGLLEANACFLDMN